MVCGVPLFMGKNRSADDMCFTRYGYRLNIGRVLHRISARFYLFPGTNAVFRPHPTRTFQSTPSNIPLPCLDLFRPCVLVEI